MVILLLKLALRQQDFVRVCVLGFALPFFLYGLGEFSVFLSIFVFQVFLNPAFKPKFYSILYRVTNAPLKKLLFISNILLLAFVTLVFLLCSLLGQFWGQFLEDKIMIIDSIGFIHQYLIVMMCTLGGLCVANILHRVNANDFGGVIFSFVLYNLVFFLMVGVFYLLRSQANETLIFIVICGCLTAIWLLSIHFYNILIK
ncbi:hypothetical protein [Thermoflexibacter ruber]|uniref:Uncharacterized protein n=1 Tax=Thermoflexibacter ruber TaxID=1003 RepID=A0A1I2JS40_9BACT|nr:hypothetical protein [Thermoflexibacter ruber]SFF56793.1 hypothetical protein SAMN04488541_106010 [Thermoflexibacter ruber]